MGIVAFAISYCLSRSIREVPVYSAKRFAAVCGDVPAEQITQQHLLQFSADAKGIAHATKRGTIRDVIVLCRSAGNVSLKQCVRALPPTPKPTPLHAIDSIWLHLPQWCRVWLAVAYWTGLRLGDSIRATIQLPAAGEYLTIQAEKTGKKHTYPVPVWLKKIDCSDGMKLKRNTDYFRHLIWDTLEQACLTCGVPVVMPQQIRQRSVNEWSKANATAGAIIHGSGLGVMTHYIDPLTVLESAAPRVRLPACFGACPEGTGEEHLLNQYRRLDPAAKSIISTTAERLAGVG
jgi:hypothetical protein